MLANIPWYNDKNPELWGVRAGSRWPHFQKRGAAFELPRYIPFPFFLAIAASSIKERGHEVSLLDGVAEGLLLEDFYAKVNEFSPHVFFAETSTPSFFYDMEVLKKIKEDFPAVKIVFAGCHSSKYAADWMKFSLFPDYWIAGEYENSLAMLIDCLASGDSAKELSIPGLIKCGNSYDPQMQLASVKDVNALPSPLFEQLPVKNYSDPVCGLPTPNAQSWLSRGCPFKCTFCVWPQLIYGGRDYRKRDIDTALDEVEFLLKNYSCESFYFDDDTANIGAERMAELAEKIIKRGLNKYPWSMMARADCMTSGVIKALASAGLYSIKYGVESISQKLLNACEKGTDLEKLKNTIELTQKAGVKIHLTFTFGLPGETRETIIETMRFAIKTAPESAQFSVCVPFPGTKFYEDCIKNKWLTTDDWGRFLGSGDDFVLQTPELPSDEFRASYNEAMGMWAKFLSDRMEKRKARLLEKLSASVGQGLKWFFLGEKDFADFIFNSDDELIFNNRVTNRNSADFAVIVSRHDEEKIYRRLIRTMTNPKNILRLYV